MTIQSNEANSPCNGKSRRSANRRSKAKQPSLDLLRLEDRLTPVVSPTGALSGFVYEDFGSGIVANDNNGVKDAGEAGIGGVTVTLVQTVGGVTTTINTKTTDANGAYSFTGLTPGGGYKVIETQPTTYSDGKDTPGTPGGGTAPQDDTITGITVSTGVISANNNFGELLGALSGFVYQDFGSGTAANDDNGLKDAGEAPIPGTTVSLFRTVNGVETPVASTTTDANGAYSFTRLLLVDGYVVRETQPAGFADGKDTAGTPGGGVAGNDVISSISLTAANRVSPNNNFGELPVPPPPPAQLSGFVYVDANNNGIKEAGEAPIPGTTVTLTLPDGTTRTAVTDANGFYSFTDLAPGAYTVTETQPANFDDGKDTAGSKGGTVTNDKIASIPLAAGDNSQNNNFGEVVQVGALSGFVYEDFGSGTTANDNNGLKDAGEKGIAGATVTLVRVVNGVATTVGSQTTDANGAYRFAGLAPGGGYRVIETQPAGYVDGKDTAGSTGGTVTNDQIDAVPVPVNNESVNNNFGELPVPPPPPAQLSGFVYVDANNDGIKDAGEAPIPGTTVTLTGPNGLTRTTTTDASGFYSFTDLAPGSYTVTETQPAAFLDGKDTAGSKGGTVTNDRIAAITLVAGDNSVNNNFGELRPAQLSGFEYQDFGSGTAANDNNGVKDAGESGIGGVAITLTGTDDLGAVSRTATTAADGSYSFANLRPGTYSVAAGQPAGYVDGKDTPGTKGGTAPQNDTIVNIPLAASDNSVNNNFGELPVPPPPPGTISGFVYVDANNDGVKDAGEAPIPGTIVTLTLPDGTTRTATTDAAGAYSFTNLAPGSYTVTETQPAAYLDGKDTAGSLGGTVTNDKIAAIVLPAGGNSVNNNFGELLPPPPPPAQLSGFVYVDANNDGIKDAGEAPIPGTTVTLTGPNGLTRTTTTDASGFYSFTDLAPGSYTVTETQPAAFLDGKDTAGSKGGTVTNDQISAIVLVAGDNSVNNNFGELPPPPPPGVGSLSGYVYVDENDDGIRDAVEKPIGGVTVTLTGNGITRTTTTDANGFYSFTALPAGAYTVSETQPAAYLDGKDTPGTKGGTLPANDVIGSIPVTAGQDSPNNNFGEKQCFTLFGYVWFDQNQNGVFDPGEPGLGGVPVTISGTTATGRTLTTGLTGGQALTVSTDATGRYAFTCLPAGTYNLAQTNTPAPYQDFRSQNAAPGLTVASSTPVSFGGIGLNQNAPGPLNFGKIIPGNDAEQPGRPNPQRPGTDSKQDFLSSTAGASSAPSITGGLLADPTVTLPLNPSFNNNGAAVRYVATGAGAGFLPVVRVFDYSTGAEKFRFSAFEGQFTGGVVTAVGDVTGDGVDDIVVGAGAGGAPRVTVYDGATGGVVRDFFAYDTRFRGGVWVAVGDINGDGRADVVTGAGEGGAAHVKVFDAVTGTEIRSFFAFDSALTTGARVAVGDFNGDGKADIAAATGAGAAPQVALFDGQTLAPIGRLTPYESGFTGGVFLAAGDVDGDGKAEVITGTGAGGGARVRVLTATGTPVYDFLADDPTFTGGVRVAARDVNGDGKADVITGGGVGGFAHVQVYSGANLGRLDDFYAFDSGVKTGVYVG